MIFQVSDSNVYVLIFVEANVSLISFTQSVYLSFNRNTLNERVFMSHPRQVFVWPVFPLLIVFLGIVGRHVSVV